MTIGDKIRAMRDTELAMGARRIFLAVCKLALKHPDADEHWIQNTADLTELRVLQKLRQHEDTVDWSWLERGGGENSGK